MNASSILRALAATCAAVVALAALPASAATLSDELAGDVNRSYVLLQETFYKEVDRQTLVDAARTAVTDAARKHGVRVSVARIRATDDDRATFDGLDAAVADAADAAHAPALEFAYAAIDGMAKAVDDRWTQFMNPADYKAFKDALDPGKDQRYRRVDLAGSGDRTDFDFLRRAGNAGRSRGPSARRSDRDYRRRLDQGHDQRGGEQTPPRQGGSVVRLGTQRGSAPVSDVMIVRLELQPPTVIHKMLAGDIGYIYVLAFGQDTPEQFDVALRRLKDQGAKALGLGPAKRRRRIRRVCARDQLAFHRTTAARHGARARPSRQNLSSAIATCGSKCRLPSS